MQIQRLGTLLLNWHSGQNDPIYAVGSFFMAGKDYPDPAIVLKARASVDEMVKAPPDQGGPKETVAAERELRTIRRGLDLYIKQRGIAPSTKTKLVIELEIDGKAADAYQVVNEILDAATLQDAINEHEFDAGPVQVTYATCKLVQSGADS